ncbi:MAG: hypothetical protein ABIG67_09880 [Pseudomonadota bacterium]
MIKVKMKIPILLAILFLMMGCATTEKKVETGQDQTQKERASADRPAPSKSPSPEQVRTDRSGFKIKPFEMEIKAGRPYLPIGAELISKEGKVPLVQVIKRLAELKGFSVSWANDVNFQQMVDVHIRPEEDFWGAIDNILRQLDYFYEMDKETIVVKYKDTKRYQLVMPTLTEKFETSVGGDLIGTAGKEGQITGKTALEVNSSEPLDFWKSVNDNIQKIIDQGAQRVVEPAVAPPAAAQPAVAQAGPSYDKGYFMMDKNLGIITVTAPKKTHEHVRDYLENLKKVMYKQVVIEAKIVEVELSDSFQAGIDWSGLMSRTFRGNIGFGDATTPSDTVAGNIYPYHLRSGDNTNIKFISGINLLGQTFDIMMEALKTYGKTNVLSNPKLTLMNGHGASITVGENRTYVSKVKTIITETGTPTYETEVSSVLSGLGMAVMANIISDTEVILYVVPVITELLPSETGEAIEYKIFGQTEVGVPRVKLREMATMAKVQSGETLIIGGHIATKKTENTNSVPLLGDIPGLGWLFKHKSQVITNTELVIFLQPRIIGSSL